MNNEAPSGFPAPAAAPEVADHTMLRPIGTGSYGEVWLARNILGSHRAIKIIYRRAFDSERPFDREFNGIVNYEPVSRSHPGLVAVLQVGRNAAEEYFYYVMELADPVQDGPPATPAARRDASTAEGRETPTSTSRSRCAAITPETYRPRTLKSELRRRGRLPARECVEVGLALANALAHLHQRGLVHRDVKPANVIFVEGRPQLADIGLVTATDSARSHLGTEGYVPPEGGGSADADLFALGKLLYELSTGCDRKEFPVLPAELSTWTDREELLALSEVIARACDVTPAKRFSSAEQMVGALSGLVGPGRAARRGRLRSAVVFAVIGAILAGAAVIVVLSARRSGPPVSRSRSTPVPVPVVESRSSTNEAVTSAFRIGRSLQGKRSFPELNKAIELYRRALTNDPGFALAQATIAECYNDMDYTQGVSSRRYRPQARAAALRAIEMDPNLSDAHAALGACKLEFDWDWAGAERDLRRALELNPDCAMANHHYGALLSLLGRQGEAVRHARLACSRSPDSIAFVTGLAHRLWSAGELEEAASHFRTAHQLVPSSGVMTLIVTSFFESMGRDADAWGIQQAYLTLGAHPPEVVERVHELFRRGGMAAIRRDSRTRGGTRQSRLFTELLLGEKDNAIAGLETEVKDRWPPVIFLRVNPLWDSVRNDPRFEALCVRIGLPAASPTRVIGAK